MSLQRPTIPPSLSPHSSFQSPRTASPAPPPPPPPRKRTSSFSVSLPSLSPNPRPAKAPRTEMQIHTGARSPLRRTESYVTIPGLNANAHTNANDKELPTSGMGLGTGLVVPYHRTLRCYKEQRERRKALIHRYPVAATTINNGNNNNSNIYTVPPPIPIQIHLPPPPSPVPSPSPSLSTSTPPTPLPRTSSPLCPTHHTSTLSSTYTHSHSRTTTSTPSTPRPPRPPFPRSKPEPDLYRKAIVTRMRCTPEGQKILHMGPRLALSIMTATRELERIVGRVGEREREREVGEREGREREQRDGRDGREGREQKGERVNGMGERGDRVGDRERDGEDVSMSESGTPVLSSSWVVVPGEDWEMVDCSA